MGGVMSDPNEHVLATPEPSALIVAPDGREVFRIDGTGLLTFAEGVQPAEAAEALVTALRRMLPEGTPVTIAPKPDPHVADELTKLENDLRAVRQRVKDISAVVRRNVHWTQREKTLLADIEKAYAELEQLRRNPCGEPAGRGEFWLGDLVRVIVEGRLESYDPELGHYFLRGNARGALHIDWLMPLHWGSEFIVLEPGPRKEEPPNA